MATTVYFSSLASDSYNNNLCTNGVAAHVLKGRKGRLRIIPSDSDKEDFIVSFIQTPDVSEFESDSDSDNNELFADDNFVSDKKRKLMKSVTREDTLDQITNRYVY